MTTPHLGLVTTLPPTPTGPADHVAHILPFLARVAQVTCFVPDPSAVDAGLRRWAGIRPLEDRRDAAVDVLNYQIANNAAQEQVIDAALEGPPGVLTLHDASQHVLVEHRCLRENRLDRFATVFAAAHDEPGRVLGRLRLAHHGLETEAYLFDMIRPLLGRHQAAVVHNRAAEAVVLRRCPGMATFVVPLSALPMRNVPDDAAGLPIAGDALVIAHFGAVTAPKRPLLLLDAFAEFVADRGDAYLVFAGAPDRRSALALAERAAGLGISDRVLVTGYLPRERMDALMMRADIVVSLRFPHHGETSGTVTDSMGAGRALIVQDVGWWAELPRHAVVHVSALPDEVSGLVAALRSLEDPRRRATLGAAARGYAATALTGERYAGGAMDAARHVLRERPRPAVDVFRERSAAIATWLLARAQDARSPLLATVPPAFAGARLLLIGPPGFAAPLAETWGYDVAAGATAALATGSMDAVLLTGPADDALLRECNRLCGPGGRLFADLADDARLLAQGFARSVPTVAGLLGAPGPAAPAPRAAAGGYRKVNLPG